MHCQFHRCTALIIALATVCLAGGLGASEPHWPSFRGPQASGIVEGITTPENWDVPKGSNVLWKTPLPGLGLSSPVKWGDRIFVTTAVKEGAAEHKIGLYGNIDSVDERVSHRWQVFCLSALDGRVLWQRTAREGIPKFKRHPKSSHANPTPATDGQHLVCFFGSEGLFCFDLEGRRRWEKDLGPLNSGYFQFPEAQWGFGSSPVIHDRFVLVQCDVLTNSFLAAFDVRDGRELWRTRRDDVPTWSTPTVVTHASRTQVVANGYRQIAGYDLHTGQGLWRLSGGGDIPVPTPVFAHGLIFITSAHGPRAPIYAIRVEATGNLSLQPGQNTNAYVAWSTPRRGNYLQTPIVVGDYLYCCSDTGVLTCYEARTGESLYSERLGDGRNGFTASPVAADGKLYCTNERGTVFVLKPGPRFGVLAKNELGEPCLATPAIGAGTLYFRTRSHLVAIGASRR
jgi:outer membrane protein assembly factor BamB